MLPPGMLPPGSSRGHHVLGRPPPAHPGQQAPPPPLSPLLPQAYAVATPSPQAPPPAVVAPDPGRGVSFLRTTALFHQGLSV
jgi:hypothetical protein